jgi:DNA-binding NarL/FixJ family response regulator
VVPVRTASGLEATLPGVDAVVVDLTARAYDGVAAIAAAAGAGRRVVAVGQHDDRDLRARALAAGAERVFPYRQLHEDGARRIEAWLSATEAPATPPSTLPSTPSARP